MSWRDPPAPNAPTLAHLVEEELHLVVNCHGCHREIRLTPTEAVDLLGPDCTMLEARDRLRCSWCGAGGRSRIDVRPCSQDMSAKRHLEAARRQRMVWPQDPSTRQGLEDAAAAWAARRPRDSAASLMSAYQLRTPISEIERDLRALGLPLIFPGGATPNDWPDLETAAPGQSLPVFRPLDPLAPAAGLGLATMRWGLVPFFHRGALAAWTAQTFNARAEIVARSRIFKSAFERRRCLVPADTLDGARERAAQMSPGTDAGWVSFAGIWDRAQTRNGLVESFALVTVEAATNAADLHQRQPVVIDGRSMALWLDLSADVSPLLQARSQETRFSLQDLQRTDPI
ncbi:MAG TPA: SOS response-associated peptidase family protein [Caulobacteraceae bacterium]|jgi:putative SOS response-associated peptidase YedK